MYTDTSLEFIISIVFETSSTIISKKFISKPPQPRMLGLSQINPEGLRLSGFIWLKPSILGIYLLLKCPQKSRES